MKWEKKFVWLNKRTKDGGKYLILKKERIGFIVLVLMFWKLVLFGVFLGMNMLVQVFFFFFVVVVIIVVVVVIVVVVMTIIIIENNIHTQETKS